MAAAVRDAAVDVAVLDAAGLEVVVADRAEEAEAAAPVLARADEELGKENVEYVQVRDINIAVNGPFLVEVANPKHQFTAILISHSRGTCLIGFSCYQLYNLSLNKQNIDRPEWS